jgi:Ca-activated chloride channel family protein
MKTCVSMILLSFFFLCGKAGAQETDKIIQKGNELYKQQQYDKAEAAYQEALEKEQGNTTAAFNRANAIFRQSKPDEAIKVLDEVVMNAAERELKGKAYYNKGVILTGQQKLEESIEAYKNALRQNPDDKEARENLQKALLELKKKNPPPPPKPDKKKQQQKKQQQQPKMNKQEAEQRLKLLEQKEKELQQRMQKEKSKAGGGQPKDW